MTEEKEVKKGESKVADAAWLRDTAERHRAFAGNSGGWFIGRTFTIDDFRDDEESGFRSQERGLKGAYFRIRSISETKFLSFCCLSLRNN